MRRKYRAIVVDEDRDVDTREAFGSLNDEHAGSCVFDDLPRFFVINRKLGGHVHRPIVSRSR